MSAPNFNNDQLGFPLYVHDDFYVKQCPTCGMCIGFYGDADEDVCDCGADLSDVEAIYDWDATEWLFNDVNEKLKELSETLMFFDASIISGYYSGMQINVEWKNIKYYGRAGDPNDLDNDDANLYFDCCRSVMLRKYERERRKLSKKLKEIADEFEFEEICCVGIFSNGEAVYKRVG